MTYRRADALLKSLVGESSQEYSDSKKSGLSANCEASMEDATITTKVRISGGVMQARVFQQGDVVVVELLGRIDVETAEPFRKVCLERLSEKKVVFNFRELAFVGSSGIIPFLETMQALAVQNPMGLKFCQVGNEFRKIFTATPLQTIEIFESQQLAILAFSEVRAVPIPEVAVAPAPLQSNSSIFTVEEVAEDAAEMEASLDSESELARE